MMEFIKLLVVLQSSFLVSFTNARCGNGNLRKWFGIISYNQAADFDTAERCSWTLAPPADTSSVLVLRLITFPILHGNNYLKNYVNLPGGLRIDQSNHRDHTHMCKKYTMPNSANTCSKAVLDHYCSGETSSTSEWPPTISSFSSQVAGIRNTSLYYLLKFTLSYVFIPCPPDVATVPSTTYSEITTSMKVNTAVRTETTTADDEMNKTNFSLHKTTAIPVYVPTRGVEKVGSFERSNNEQSSTEKVETPYKIFLIGVSSASAILLLALIITVIMLARKLRCEKFESGYEKYLDNATYCYALDVNGGSDTINGYATVSSLRKQTGEMPSRRQSDYLTMRKQDSRKELTYEEIKSRTRENDLYATALRHKGKSRDSGGVDSDEEENL